MNDAPTDLFHVILVEPQNSLNIGAVARAMMNLGFRHLHLVAPLQYDRERAQVTARNAGTLLEGMSIHETLTEALSGMEDVVGFALRKGYSPAHYVTLPEWAGGLLSRPACKTALVFGAEGNGLSQEQLNQCRWIVRIPSAEEFSAFNLAQSVLLALYEITRTLPNALPTTLEPPEPVPTWNEFYQLDRLLDAVMQETGFVREGSPTPVPSTVKGMFRRLAPNTHEIRILLSLVGRIHTTLRRNEASRE